MNVSVSARLEDLGYEIEALGAGIKEMIDLQVGQIASAAQAEWIRLAQARLKTSRELYINGLRQGESFNMYSSGGRHVYEISLVGQMPNNIEFGMSPFDMKVVRPGWLGGSKAKTSKDGGKYVVIPFRHSMSSDNRFAYSGKAAAVDDPSLKSRLKQTVKDYGLNRMIRTATGQVVEGPVKRVPNNASAVHPYLRGLTRYQTAQEGTTSTGKQRGSGSLMTFRVMSTKSRPDSWQHPGIQAANLLQEVEQFANAQLDRVIQNILGG